MKEILMTCRQASMYLKSLGVELTPEQVYRRSYLYSTKDKGVCKRACREYARMQRMIGSTELAKMFGIERTLIYWWIKEKGLRYEMHFGRRYFSKEYAIAWYNNYYKGIKKYGE